MRGEVQFFRDIQLDPHMKIHDIVLVDNEIDFLNELSELIASDTRRVTPFTDPRHALFYAKLNSFSTLISDFHMPFIDGVKLANEVLSINPRTRIIIMSGALIDKRMLLSNWLFLSKPFGHEQLEHCMHAVQ